MEHKLKEMIANYFIDRVPMLEVIRYLDLESMARIRLVNKASNLLLWDPKSPQLWWRLCCDKICTDFRLYIPIGFLENSCVDWRSIFLNLLPRRGMWIGNDNSASDDCLVSVSCRFRSGEDSSMNGIDPGLTDRLPLHQRIQLMKARNEDVAKLELYQELSGDSSAKDVAGPWKNSECLKRDDGDQNSSRMMASTVVGSNFGPNNEKGNHVESNMKHFSKDIYGSAVLSVNSKTHSVLCVSPGVGLREFRFDRVFDDHCTQVLAPSIRRYEWPSLPILIHDYKVNKSFCRMRVKCIGARFPRRWRVASGRSD